MLDYHEAMPNKLWYMLGVGVGVPRVVPRLDWAEERKTILDRAIRADSISIKSTLPRLSCGVGAHRVITCLIPRPLHAAGAGPVRGGGRQHRDDSFGEGQMGSALMGSLRISFFFDRDLLGYSR